MIDKSLRQYYESGQLVRPGKGRPGYQGTKLDVPFEGARTLVRKEDVNKYNTTDKMIVPSEGARTLVKNPNYISPEKREYEADLSQIGKGARKIAYSPAEKAAIKKGTLKPQLGDLTNFLYKSAEDPTYKEDLLEGTTLGALKKGREQAGAVDYIEDIIKSDKAPEKAVGGTGFVAENKGRIDAFANSVLSNWGLRSQDIKNIKEGNPISKVATDILKRQLGLGGKDDEGLGWQAKAKKGLKVGKGVLNVLDMFSGTGSIANYIGPAAAVAAIAYLHKNRERFTGYAPQKGYADARD